MCLGIGVMISVGPPWPLEEMRAAAGSSSAGAAVSSVRRRSRRSPLAWAALCSADALYCVPCHYLAIKSGEEMPMSMSTPLTSEQAP